ncbi:MAG: hypothetical protein AAFZ65_19780 [Planctomycetota bacterium]
MSPTHRRRRRSGAPLFILVVGALGLLTAAGWYAQDQGYIELSFLDREAQAAEDEELKAGQIKVPLSTVAIPAYTKVTRDHLIRPADLLFNVLVLEEERVEELGILVDPSDIIGRVLAQDKSPNRAFSEDNFLPEGTRPGLVGGIPTGMRGLTIEVEAVRGIAALSPGDRFDILAAQPVESDPGSSIAFSGVFGDRARAETARMGATKRARVDVLVQSGIVVLPLSTRQVPVATSSLTSGLTVRTKPVQEITVALRPDEVSPLMEALAVEAELSCVPRSGRPDDPLDSITPSIEPPLPSWMSDDKGTGGLSLVDRIDGADRQIVPVPARGGSNP